MKNWVQSPPSSLEIKNTLQLNQCCALKWTSQSTKQTALFPGISVKTTNTLAHMIYLDHIGL
jgi:hypothetical protein